jgi:hypothetical protein
MFSSSSAPRRVRTGHKKKRTRTSSPTAACSSVHFQDDGTDPASDGDAQLDPKLIATRNRLKIKQLPDSIQKVFKTVCDSLIKSILTEDPFMDSSAIKSRALEELEMAWAVDPELRVDTPSSKLLLSLTKEVRMTPQSLQQS